MIDFSPKHDCWIRNDDGSLSRMDEPYFRSEKLAEGVWRILSSGDYAYLLEGDEEALAIDCGYGAGNIREYMQTLTDKPVRFVANTHDHFDHTANNSYFEGAYMAEAGLLLATLPFPSFEGIDFPTDYPRMIVHDGDIIPLKGREILCLLIPDHAAGSVAYLDRRSRILFSGDEFISNRKNLNFGLRSWKEKLEKLMKYRGDFDFMHAGGGEKDPELIPKMLGAAKIGLATGGEPAPVGGGRPQPEFNEKGEKIYGRMAPHPEDTDHPPVGRAEDRRIARFEDVEIVFYKDRIND